MQAASDHLWEAKDGGGVERWTLMVSKGVGQEKWVLVAAVFMGDLRVARVKGDGILGAMSRALWGTALAGPMSQRTGRKGLRSTRRSE